METYLTITHKDEYEQNWQYDGYNSSDANVIYDTRWDDHIKGSDNDQQIYLTHGNDIVDGKGGTDTVHIDELSTDYAIIKNNTGNFGFFKSSLGSGAGCDDYLNNNGLQNNSIIFVCLKAQISDIYLNEVEL